MSFNSLTGDSLQTKGKVDGALKVSVTLTAEPSEITIVVLFVLKKPTKWYLLAIEYGS